MTTTVLNKTEAKETDSVTEQYTVGQALPPLNINDIMSRIPHRYPFLLIDAITEHFYGTSIKGYKNVTINEPFFQGHFPNNPVMPGVLQLEALAQLGGVLLSHLPHCKNKLMVFAGIDAVRFRRIVLPGDRLDMECVIVKLRSNFGKSKCKALVNGEVVVEAELMFSLIDNPNPHSNL